MNPFGIILKPRVVAAFVAFSLFAFSSTTVLADAGVTDSRYFVPSTRSFWRNTMGARHVFDTGFTADLNDLQLGIAKFAGLKPVPVEKYNILADMAVGASVSATPLMTPTQPVSWGVRAMLDDDTLTGTTGGAGVTVAILDTGVDRTHPDLKSRINRCEDFTNPSGALIDNSCDDLNGHGTHIAGIIAADGGLTGTGLYGLAPQASISIYRTCNTGGSCFADDVATALRVAVDDGANIIVLGLGGESDSQLVDDAIAYAQQKKVMVIAGAGNDGPYDDSEDWPARNPAVVSVGAIDSKKAAADFSSRGDIELGAPGVNIESTFRDDGYAILSGTSMAAPHVAGIAARLWVKDASDPAQATRDLLHKISVDIAPPGDDGTTGWGMPEEMKK